MTARSAPGSPAAPQGPHDHGGYRSATSVTRTSTGLQHARRRSWAFACDSHWAGPGSSSMTSSQFSDGCQSPGPRACSVAASTAGQISASVSARLGGRGGLPGPRPARRSARRARRSPRSGGTSGPAPAAGPGRRRSGPLLVLLRRLLAAGELVAEPRGQPLEVAGRRPAGLGPAPSRSSVRKPTKSVSASSLSCCQRPVNWNLTSSRAGERPRPRR